MIVVLNDNDMSIAPPVGAMSAYLSRLISSRPFLSLRELMGKMARRFPRPLEQAARRADEFARGLLTGGTLFEELGFYYVGPIDGHDLDHLHAGAAQPPGHGSPGADPAACRDPEGQGLRARRAQRRQVPWRREVQCRHRRAVQGAARPAVLHQGLRQGAGRRGRGRSTDRRRDGGDAVRHRPRSFRQAFPGPHLRCRHRRAARRHLRRRHGDRRA